MLKEYVIYACDCCTRPYIFLSIFPDLEMGFLKNVLKNVLNQKKGLNRESQMLKLFWSQEQKMK